MPPRKGKYNKKSAWLPATPCTPEFREQVVAVADKHGISIASLQREALSLFLARVDRKLSISDSSLSKPTTSEGSSS